MIAFGLPSGLHRRPGRANLTPLPDTYRPRHCSGVPGDGRSSSCFHVHHDEIRCRCGQAVLRPGFVSEVVVDGTAHTGVQCTQSRRLAEPVARRRLSSSWRRGAAAPAWAVPGAGVAQ